MRAHCGQTSKTARKKLLGSLHTAVSQIGPVLHNLGGGAGGPVGFFSLVLTEARELVWPRLQAAARAKNLPWAARKAKQKILAEPEAFADKPLHSHVVLINTRPKVL